MGSRPRDWPRSKPPHPLSAPFRSPSALPPFVSHVPSADSRGWITTFFRGEIKGSVSGLLVCFRQSKLPNICSGSSASRKGYRGAAEAAELSGRDFQLCRDGTLWPESGWPTGWTDAQERWTREAGLAFGTPHRPKFTVFAEGKRAQHLCRQGFVVGHFYYSVNRYKYYLYILKTFHK